MSALTCHEGAKEMTTFAHLAGCVSSKAALNVLLMGKLPRLDIEHIKYNNQNSSIYIKKPHTQIYYTYLSLVTDGFLHLNTLWEAVEKKNKCILSRLDPLGHVHWTHLNLF